MRVVLTANFSPWSAYSGGGQRSTHQLACALAALGHEVTVVFTKTPRDEVNVPGALPYKIQWAHFVGLSSSRAAPLRPLNALTVRNVVKGLCEAQSIDVVHSQGEEGAMLQSLRREHGFGLVVTPRYPWYPNRLRPHASLVDKARLWLFDAKYPVLGKLINDADAVCPTSQSAADSIVDAFGTDPSKIETVPNGINPAFWEADWCGDVTDVDSEALFFGRLDHDKGLDLLLTAMKTLTDLRLHVVGRGDLESSLKQQAKDIGLQSRIQWTPWCEPTELIAKLRTTRLAILPSRHESFGNVMAESMAVGVPLVTCSAGSIPEVVGTHAWMAAPDDAESLAAAISSATSNQQIAHQRAKQGRDFVRKKFHWHEVAAHFESIYERVVNHT